jgi:transcriptional regulator with XRE-family HTH domain
VADKELVELGRFIRAARIKAGYGSQRLLAEHSGISNGTIARIENGMHRPKPETLEILSEFISADYEELLEKAGYIGDYKKKEIESNRPREMKYDSLEEINKLVEKYGIEQMGFFDIEEWKNLGPEDIRMLEEQFKLIVKLAKERNEEK